MKLEARIMNLPTKASIEKEPVHARVLYKEGHRDARHAAAELAATHDALMQQMVEALELIAGTDPVDAALDPQRAVRVAAEALRAYKEQQ